MKKLSTNYNSKLNKSNLDMILRRRDELVIEFSRTILRGTSKIDFKKALFLFEKLEEKSFLIAMDQTIRDVLKFCKSTKLAD